MPLQNKSIISFTALAVILIAGGVWYARKGAPETPPPDGGAGQAVDSLDDSAVDDGVQEGGVDTSGWVAYQQNGYYEYKIPKNWKIQQGLAEVYIWIEQTSDPETSKMAIQITEPELVDSRRPLSQEEYHRKYNSDYEEEILIDDENGIKFFRDNSSTPIVVFRYSKGESDYEGVIYFTSHTGPDLTDLFIQNFTIINE